jgi:putative selenate reductase
MDTVGADSIASYIIRAYGLGSAALARLNIEDPASRSACEAALDSGADLAAVAGGDLYRRWVAEAALCNTDHYVPRATADTRYARVRNSKPPTKVGSHLELFDCITCNKCVPVCPNNANFVFVLPRLEQPIHKMRFTGETWTSRTDGTLVIDQKQQYGNFADFCNDCGNCDVFCPEDGGPYVVKPRFFGSLEDWREFDELDGFAVERNDGEMCIWGRVEGIEFSLGDAGDRALFTGPDFAVTLDPDDPVTTVEGTAASEIDLTYLHILRWMRDAVFHADRVNYVNALYDL